MSMSKRGPWVPVGGEIKISGLPKMPIDAIHGTHNTYEHGSGRTAADDTEHPDPVIPCESVGHALAVHARLLDGKIVTQVDRRVVRAEWERIAGMIRAMGWCGRAPTPDDYVRHVEAALKAMRKRAVLGPSARVSGLSANRAVVRNGAPSYGIDLLRQSVLGIPGPAAELWQTAVLDEVGRMLSSPYGIDSAAFVHVPAAAPMFKKFPEAVDVRLLLTTHVTLFTDPNIPTETALSMGLALVTRYPSRDRPVTDVLRLHPVPIYATWKTPDGPRAILQSYNTVLVNRFDGEPAHTAPLRGTLTLMHVLPREGAAPPPPELDRRIGQFTFVLMTSDGSI